jgi:hypothetical protein
MRMQFEWSENGGGGSGYCRVTVTMIMTHLIYKIVRVRNGELSTSAEEIQSMWQQDKVTVETVIISSIAVVPENIYKSQNIYNLHTHTHTNIYIIGWFLKPSL